jgi:uncharacterized DUF497 family protein
LEQFGNRNFEWDDAKQESNLDKHDIGFFDARRLFDRRPTIEVRSSFELEERFLTTGFVGNRLITVVWTRRNAAIRIIPARRARDGEHRAYRALYGEGN